MFIDKALGKGEISENFLSIYLLAPGHWILYFYNISVVLFSTFLVHF